jgi:hypothetical protein
MKKRLLPIGTQTYDVATINTLRGVTTSTSQKGIHPSTRNPSNNNAYWPSTRGRWSFSFCRVQRFSAVKAGLLGWCVQWADVLLKSCF